MTMQKEYVLPLSGKIVDWSTLSGDLGDPVRPVGLEAFLSGWTWPSAIPEKERTVRQSVLEIDWELSTAIVLVTAPEPFIQAFDAYVKGKSSAEIAVDVGKPILIKPDNVSARRERLARRLNER